MSLFKNKTHQDIWIESNCASGCHAYAHPDTVQHMRKPQCLILKRALRTDRKPPEWERNPRKNVLMAETIKCKAKSRTPLPKPRVDNDVAMFDVAAPIQMDADHA